MVQGKEDSSGGGHIAIYS